MSVERHLEKLGLQVEDRVTGFKGVATSVSFDLYGCIQVIVHPGVDASGKMGEQCWFDIGRLKVVGGRVMHAPDFQSGPAAEGLKGPAEKPSFPKS